MPRLKQIQTFVDVAARGSLSAAAQAEGVVPAIVGRRLNALEERLGVKLLIRTTRRVSLTREGELFLEDCQRILGELEEAEESIGAGIAAASGHLRVTAPAGFGRQHVAPLMPAFLETFPAVTLSLDLSDRVVDLVEEGYDCAVRLGDLPDSTLSAVRLGETPRVCVASPTYLARHGTPATPNDLHRHRCLVLGDGPHRQRGWTFTVDRKPLTVRVDGAMRCSDGAVIHAWCLAHQGLAWRSWWEVGEDVRAGRLVPVLDRHAAPPTGIHAVFPHRRHLPARVRALLDHLRAAYAGDRRLGPDDSMPALARPAQNL
ncbi:LysR family transcriptional regulator [Chitinasiproducens palmae]|uniref:DNA-binding transcriptional regulator, LysR family n=1 Tax=Chitinasiproducens palmae TaxID=1770053 RepID=A0A1H2PV96_9BURK|nr:LysR family transcriptional regulator [Chitinasiproducens palmae]SDV51196.1 DNA-binding transcriptional regulator, LysR family [Chitinasiproducens palmae]